MKQIYISLLLVVFGVSAWGQNGRVHTLSGPDTTVISTRSYSDQYDNSFSGLNASTKKTAIDELSGRTIIDTSGIDTDSLTVNAALREISLNEQRNRRKFQTFDWFLSKKTLLEYTGKEIFSIGNANYPISPSPLRTSIGDSYVQDTLVDGIFLDTVNINIAGDNIVRSTHPITYPVVAGDPAWVCNARLLQNFGIAPDETRTATGFVGTANTAFIDVVNHQPDSSYVVSVYVKAHNISSSINVLARWNSVGTYTTLGTIEPGDTEWDRKYNVIIPASTVQPYFLLNFAGISSTDTIEFWIPQVEVDSGSGVPTAPKPTFFVSPRSGRAYINRGYALLEGGVLDLSKLKQEGFQVNRRSGDDTPFLEAAANYCLEGQRCNVVKLDKGFYNVSRLVGKEGVVFSGPTEYRRPVGSISAKDRARFGTLLRITQTDSTQSPFIFHPYGGNQMLNSSGLQNVSIIVYDTINTVVNVKECQNCIFRNISVERDGVGKIDTAYLFDVVIGSDAYKNSIEDISAIGNNSGAGIVYKGSTDNKMDRLLINNFETGIYVVGGNELAIDGAIVQGCDNAFKIDGGNIYVDRAYTEGSGKNSGAVVRMTAGNAVFRFGTFQSNTASDTLFSIDNAGRFSVDNSNIRIQGRIKISTQVAKASFTNVGSQSSLRSLAIGKGNIFVRGNFDYNTNEPFEDYIPKPNIDLAHIENSAIRNSYFSDTAYVSNLILAGKNVNYIAYSDSFPHATITGNSVDTVFIGASDVPAPDGSMTAKKLTYNTGDLGFGSLHWFSRSSATFTAGSDFVYSVWVYNHQAEDIVTDLFHIRPGSTDNNTVLNAFLPAQEWTRVFVRGRIHTTGSGFTTRLSDPQNISPGDEISVWGQKAEEGDIMTSYYSTQSSTDINTDINILAKGNSSINFLSDVRITGALQAEKYRSFNPITHNATDTIPADTLNTAFPITPDIDATDLQQVTYTTDAQVSGDLTIRLLYKDVSADSYTAIGSGTITTGNNQVTVTGLTQTVTSGDLIYPEVTASDGGGPGTTPPNGLHVSLKFK